MLPWFKAPLVPQSEWLIKYEHLAIYVIQLSRYLLNIYEFYKHSLSLCFSFIQIASRIHPGWSAIEQPHSCFRLDVNYFGIRVLLNEFVSVLKLSPT